MAEENPGECDCCGFQTKELELFKGLETTIAAGTGRTTKDDFWYCVLCCSTPAGLAHRYPGRYPDSTSMATTCYVGNVILTELRRKQKA